MLSMTTYPTMMPSGALGNSAGKSVEQQVFRNGNHHMLLNGIIIRLLYLFGSRISGVRVSSIRPLQRLITDFVMSLWVLVPLGVEINHPFNRWLLLRYFGSRNADSLFIHLLDTVKILGDNQRDIQVVNIHVAFFNYSVLLRIVVLRFVQLGFQTSV